MARADLTFDARPQVGKVAGLAFSRAIGEFGSVVLIGGAVPGETEVSSQWIRTLIENDDRTGAAAISTHESVPVLNVEMRQRRGPGVVVIRTAP